MSTVKQILQQASRSREPKSPQIYRRGRVTNSAAYYRGVKPDPEAGRINATAAKFLADIAKPLGQIAGRRQKEFAEAERNAGIASFTRATPEQRAKMRNAIKNGIISESESPYFREGVSIAYTKNLLSKYNQDLFQRYEKWDKKNKEDSGNFDQFLDEFDSEYAPYFETIHQDILTEHFIPGQMGIRRQLQQRHTEHLNKNYRESAEAQLQNTMFDAVNDRANDATTETVTNGLSYGDSVTKGRKNDGVELDELIVMRQAVEDGLTEEEFEKRSVRTLQRKVTGYDSLLSSKEKQLKSKKEELASKKEELASKTKTFNERLDSINVSEPIKSLKSFAEKAGVSEKTLMEALKRIKKPRYVGGPKPDGKEKPNLSYIDPRNWTESQTSMVIQQLKK